MFVGCRSELVHGMRALKARPSTRCWRRAIEQADRPYGWLRGIPAEHSLLREFVVRGQIKVKDPALAADLFLNLVFGTSERLSLYGIATDPKV